MAKVPQLFLNEYVSFPRNKQIAKIVKELGWIEKYGTGIKRVQRLFETHGLQKPEFCSVQNGLLVKVFSDNSLLGMVTENGTDRVTDKVTDIQTKILQLIGNDKYISASEMAGEIGISKRKTIDKLNKLKEKQLLRRVGENKTGHWEIVKP